MSEEVTLAMQFVMARAQEILQRQVDHRYITPELGEGIYTTLQTCIRQYEQQLHQQSKQSKATALKETPNDIPA